MFWEDLLADSDTRMNVDFEDKFKSDAIAPLTMKLAWKAQGFAMKYAQKLNEAGKWAPKIEWSTGCGEFNFGGKWSAKDAEMTVCMKPEAMNSGGSHACIEAHGETNFKDETWEASTTLCCGGMEMGPMKPYTHLALSTDNGGEHGVSWCQNIAMDDMNLGWKLKADKAGKLGMANGAFVMTQGKHKYYARGDFMHNFFGIGGTCDCTIMGMEAKHAMEMQYDVGKCHEGIAGQPLFLRFGGDYVFSEKLNVNYSLVGGQTWEETTKFNFAVNDTTKVNLTGRCTINNFFTDPKNYLKDIGLTVEFKA